MTLYTPKQATSFWTYDNFGANPSATFGTSITAGAANAEGSWTQVATGTNIAQDVGGLYLQIHTLAATGNLRPMLVDVGVDPTGGSSYTEKIANIDGGQAAGPTVTGLKCYYFPLSIKKGSSVAVRGQTNYSAITFRAACKFYAKMPFMPAATYAETFGAAADSSGTGFTPGNAADGSWTSLGTTTKPLWWWQLSYDIWNTTVTAEYTYIDLAYGDASNKRIITRITHLGTTAETIGAITGNSLLWDECYFPVPAGVNIYVRGRCNNAPDTGYRAIAIGVGGEG